MRRDFLVFTIILASSLAACPPGTEDDSDLNRCYMFISDPAPFFAAEQRCQTEGGHLVSLMNAFENLMFLDTIHSMAGMTDRFYWIGATKLLSHNGSWTWTDSQPFSYTSWAPGEPNIAQQCAEMRSGNGHWSATNCSTPHPFFCDIPPISKTESPACPTSSPRISYCQTGWTYLEYTDSCYRVFHNATFYAAESLCTRAQSRLASIHSNVENSFIHELATTGWPVSTESAAAVWIGLRRVNDNWANTDDSNVDFFNWAQEEPIPLKDGSENCVQLFSDNMKELEVKGRWNVGNCNDVVRSLVCKKPAFHSK